jgi:hypothetical protein
MTFPDFHQTNLSALADSMGVSTKFRLPRKTKKKYKRIGSMSAYFMKIIEVEMQYNRNILSKEMTDHIIRLAQTKGISFK